MIFWHVKVYFGVIPAIFCESTPGLSHAGWATAREVGKIVCGQNCNLLQSHPNTFKKGIMDVRLALGDAVAC